MERRVLLAVFLSFLVLYAYQALFVPPAPPDTAKQQPAGASDPATPKPDAGATPPSPSPGAVQSAPRAAPQPAAVITEPGERRITVETATVEAVLSNRGGRVVSWKL